jgi:predicted RNA-binding Zn ribbon-like protein
MNFNSYGDAVVEVSAALVNVATPGDRQGRPYSQLHGTALAAAIDRVLRLEGRPAPHLAASEAEELARSAQRLRLVFEKVAGGDLDAAVGVVNALLEQTQPAPYLDRHDGQPWHLHFHSRSHDIATGWAASCAMALAVVLDSPYADRLGVCGAQACDRVYIDSSRNATRRFCSILCQNRVKAAAHRARSNRTACEATVP